MEPDRYGALKALRFNLPADRLLTLRQSKNLSNNETNFAVSSICSFPDICMALATELLRTYRYDTKTRYMYIFTKTSDLFWESLNV